MDGESTTFVDIYDALAARATGDGMNADRKLMNLAQLRAVTAEIGKARASPQPEMTDAGAPGRSSCRTYRQ